MCARSYWRLYKLLISSNINVCLFVCLLDPICNIVQQQCDGYSMMQNGPRKLRDYYPRVFCGNDGKRDNTNMTATKTGTLCPIMLIIKEKEIYPSLGSYYV